MKNVQQELETKFKDILILSGIPAILKKELQKIQKQIPSYFEKGVFFNKEEIKALIINATGLAGWKIKEFNSLKDKKAIKNYCEYSGFEENEMEFDDDTIIYIMTRKSFGKYELCGLEISYGSGSVQLTESTLSASGCGFTSTKKDFVKELNKYYKNI